MTDRVAAEAPQWFLNAVQHQPERRLVPVDGADIEALAWGEVGRPGLMLLHGNAAHADWWRFIAPFFAETHRVAAVSWSGMGRSQWRQTYSIDVHVREALRGAEAMGVFASRERPVFLAHSFGGAPLMQLAAAAGERLARAIIVDNGARPASEELAPRVRTRANPVYPDREAALRRFRLAPSTSHALPFIERFLAEGSVRKVDSDVGGGWTWAFDPFAHHTRGLTHIPRAATLVPAARCPLTFIRGEESALMSREMLEFSCRIAPEGSHGLEIPCAGHHVMVDQPLAFVAALRVLLAAGA